MAKRKTNNEQSVTGLGDTELVLLTSAGQRDDQLIDAPSSVKPASRQRAGANLIRRGWAEERPAKRDEPAWREDENGRGIALRATAAGLALIGIEVAEENRPAVQDAPSQLAQPRDGSKGALVIGMLSRPEGAGIDELIGATGWLPHTTRAALTGLRKRGYEVSRERDDDGRSRYRIPVQAPEPAPPASKRGRRPKATEAQAAA